MKLCSEQGIIYKIGPLTSRCDLYLWFRVMFLVHAYSSWWTFLPKIMNLWSYCPYKAYIAKYWRLNSIYDFDIWHRVMGFVRDTPTQHDNYFDHTIWKCDNNFWRYGPDIWHMFFFLILTSKCDTDLDI